MAPSNSNREAAMRHEPLVLTLAVLLSPLSLRGQGVESPLPDPGTAAGPLAARLAPGAHIRMRGDSVDELGRPTGREMLTFGLLGAHLFRSDAEGTVLFADGDSLVFADRKRGGVISLEWERLESVELYRGRDVGRGALEGAAWGAVGGLVMWGVMEVVFSGDFWDVDGAMIMATSTGAGVIGGAMSLGDRWEPVHPLRP